MVTYEPWFFAKWSRFVAADGSWIPGKKTVGRMVRRAALENIFNDRNWIDPYPLQGRQVNIIGPPINTAHSVGGAIPGAVNVPDNPWDDPDEELDRDEDGDGDLDDDDDDDDDLDFDDDEDEDDRLIARDLDGIVVDALRGEPKRDRSMEPEVIEVVDDSENSESDHDNDEDQLFVRKDKGKGKAVEVEEEDVKPEVIEVVDGTDDSDNEDDEDEHIVRKDKGKGKAVEEVKELSHPFADIIGQLLSPSKSPPRLSSVQKDDTTPRKQKSTPAINNLYGIIEDDEGRMVIDLTSEENNLAVVHDPDLPLPSIEDDPETKISETPSPRRSPIARFHTPVRRRSSSIARPETPIRVFSHSPASMRLPSARQHSRSSRASRRRTPISLTPSRSSSTRARSEVVRSEAAWNEMARTIHEGAQESKSALDNGSKISENDQGPEVKEEEKGSSLSAPIIVVDEGEIIVSDDD